jgi:hypothetical protein
VQALPLLVLGVMLSGALKAFVPPALLQRFAASIEEVPAPPDPYEY